jgi:hypothetical protein
MSGGAAVGFDSNSQLWKVLGPGTLTRNAPVVVIRVPAFSQFYNKIVVHENRHVQQFISGINADLFTVTSLMSQVSGVTDPTEAGLTAKFNAAFKSWYLNQQVIALTRGLAMEEDAYAISDLVIPRYAYQLCQ